MIPLVRDCIIKEMSVRAEAARPAWDTITYFVNGFNFRHRPWLLRGIRSLTMRPLRSLSNSELNCLAELGLERPVMFHKEWIQEHRSAVACSSPRFVENVKCKKPKECKVAWEWAWADGVRVGLLHPYQPKADWDMDWSLSSAAGQIPFLCAACHKASYEALSSADGLSLNKEHSMNERFVDYIEKEHWLNSESDEEEEMAATAD